MGFWIFMLASNFFIPLLMMGIGKWFMVSPPNDINDFFGYRTTRSKKSQEAWDFAQRYLGKLWWKLGFFMLPLSVILMLPVFGREETVVGIWGGIQALLECVALIISIVPVEQALKRNFG